jgi:hypothetical protein
MDFEITKTLNLTPSSIYNLEIIERTPTLLKLKAKGPSAFSSFSGLVVSITYILVVLIMLIYTPTLTTLKCNRLTQNKVVSGQNKVVCDLIYSSFVYENLTPISVEEYQGAKLRQNKKGTMYGITLLTNKKDIPLYDLSTSSEKIAVEKVKKINDFINDSAQKYLEIQQSDRWSFYTSLGFSLLFGSGVFSSTIKRKLSITCVFDKDADRMYLEQKNLFGNIEIREEIMYEIRLAQRVIKTNKDGTIKYNIKLVLKSDEEITILPSYVSYNTHKIARTINHFLEHQSRKKSD